MKIFVTGGDGQLGKCLKSFANKGDTLKFASRNDLDITNPKEVLSVITAFKPNIVLHFAAKTRGDDCARDPKVARLINVRGTRNIITACKNIGADLLFISTNEVFDGKKRSPYSEKDKPNPISIVGKQKFQAEQAIRNSMRNYYIVRTMWLYSEYSSNFLQAIFDKARKNIRVRIVDDEIGSPTSTAELARAILKLIKTKKYGTYHLANRGQASRYEFAMVALNAADISNIKILPVKLSDYKRLSPPPKYSPLSSAKAEKLGILFSDWKVPLIQFVKKNKEYLSNTS